MDTTDDTDTDFWKPLGRQFWTEAAEQLGATERQARFAAARFRGCSATQAARECGLTGNADTLQQSAYRMVRTSVVASLLALASAEAGGGSDGTVDQAEARRIISKLARGSDPAIRLRACELLDKLDTRQAELGKAPSDDGFGEWRTCRDYLTMGNGGVAFCYLWRGCSRELSAMPMLLDVADRAKREDQEAWDRLVARITATDRDVLERHLNDPTWQLDARVKMWREIGREIDLPAGVDAPPARSAKTADAATSEM